MPRREILTGLGWLVLLLIFSAGIGMVTNAGKDDFYDPLVKSALNPPGWVFGVVWPILYLMIGTVGWLMMRVRPPLPRALWGLYVGQLALNWGWSFVFFTFHQIALAFFWIVALAILVAVLIMGLWRINRWAALLLTPYLAWLGFASYLAGTIWWLN
jgi:tryptophan-rich sensory protein